MNIRMPGEMAEDIVRVQDEFLMRESEEKGIVKLSDIKTIKEQYGRGFNVFKDIDKNYYEERLALRQ